MTEPYWNIVLCRGAVESDLEDKYIEAFTNKGYSCKILPTLHFKFININLLKECLLSPQLYAGLILTSKRAAEAVKLAIQEQPSILYLWKSLPTYCVGPATAAFVKSELKLENCYGSESGNAEELSKSIIKHTSTKCEKKLLYPCNEIARETIQKRLEDCDISVNRIVSYQPIISETLEHDVLAIIGSMPCILVFFSPSIVAHVLRVIKKQFLNFDQIKAVAIGPATQQALIDAGYAVYATAKKPEPDSLVQAILEVEKTKNEN